MSGKKIYDILQAIKNKNPSLSDGYLLDLVTCVNHRGFTKHYAAKIKLCIQSSKCDFSYVKDMYGLISRFLSWINPAIMPSLQEIDKVQRTISKEEKKQISS